MVSDNFIRVTQRCSARARVDDDRLAPYSVGRRIVPPTLRNAGNLTKRLGSGADRHHLSCAVRPPLVVLSLFAVPVTLFASCNGGSVSQTSNDGSAAADNTGGCQNGRSTLPL